MRSGLRFILVFTFLSSLQVAIKGGGNRDMVIEEECSKYSFHKAYQSYSWEKASELCSRTQNSWLVSMESCDEWKYIKNITRTKTGRWYVGLKYNFSKWCWLGNTNDCINKTFPIPGKWRWHNTEPNHLNKEHCVEMYQDGKYNNIDCNSNYEKRGVSNGGYICEQKVDCTNTIGKHIFKIQKKIVQPLSTEKINPVTPDAVQSTFSQTTSMQPFTLIQETTLSVQQSSDMSSDAKHGGSSITVITITVLVVLLVVLLVFLVCIVWRRRVSKKREDQVERQEIESNGMEVLPSRQRSYDQTQASMNDTCLTEVEREGALDVYDNYSAVERTKNTPVHSGMPVTQQLELDDSEPTCVTLRDPSKSSLETEDRLYANVNLVNQNHSPNPCTSRGKIPKVPGEHTDEADCKKDYIYAVVDKKRKRIAEPFTSGPVYADLDFQPLQDEVKLETTNKEPFTVYASIEEGHVL